MTSDAPISSVKFINGYWLIIARVIWVSLCIISIGFLIIALTSTYLGWIGEGQSCNVPMPDRSMRGDLTSDCESKQRAFQELGLPVWFPAILFTAGAGVEVASWILVGILIFWRRSHKPFEYFFSLMLVVSGTFNFDDSFASTGRNAISTLTPLFRLVGPLGSIIAVAIYFFPDGQLAHRSLRWFAGFWVLFNLSSVLLRNTPYNFGTWPSLLHATINAGIAISIVFALAYRYRYISGPIQRQQIKLAVASAIIFLLVFVSGFPLIYIFPPISASEPGPVQALVWLLYLPIYYLARVFVASALLFSIMRYRLWDIDFLINRSLVYGSLTVLLAMVFGGILWLVSFLVRGQEFIIAFGITAVLTGLLFNPTRRVIQRFVDQRFYHINIDYQRTPLDISSSSATQVLRTTQFGVYQNLELIGRGGMADVYKSVHPQLNQPVAIKILPAWLAEEAEFRQRFTREAQVVSHLTHPNIIRVFDSGEAEGKYYMVMEYLTGQDLDKFIRANGRLALAQALPLVQQIAAALDYAHSQGFIHRDIKPSNVLLDTSEDHPRAILTDFGIAKIINARTTMTRTGSVMGTFDYIAPEQIQESSTIDHRADIYALGIMTFEMLTGEMPFKHNNPGALLIAHLSQPPPDACAINTDLSKSICNAIQRAMAKKPEERFPTASEFATALN